LRPQPAYITKSRYKLALECPSKLFYTRKDKYANQNEEEEFLMALAEGGFQVGELAKYYHPGGKDITTLGYQESLSETNELLEQENIIIYEAAIQFETFFIRADVLVKSGNKIDLIEVKARSFRSKEEFYSSRGFLNSSWRPYLYDIAFQTWVTQQAFPEWVIKPYLMLADKNKKTSVDGLNQLFVVKKDSGGRKTVSANQEINSDLLGDEILVKVGVSDIVQMIWDGKDINPAKKSIEDRKDFVLRAKEYSKYYSDDIRYPVSLGSKCKHCEFNNKHEPAKKSGFEECWESIFPDFDVDVPHLFDLWRFRRSQSFIDQGVYTLGEVYSDVNFAKMLNERQYLQVEKTVKRSEDEYINPDLFHEMDQWNFPLHFIDFETSMVAIPFHKGRYPYEQIAFQFSCHTVYKDKQVEHVEWIETERGKFPNYDFVKALKSVLDKDNGTIFRYAAHENTVLRQIQKQMINENEEQFGEWIEWIDSITEWRDEESKEKFESKRNMVDILKLVRKYYYHPIMKGSNSIKAVLPAIFSTSDFIKNRYSRPVGFGLNLKDQILWKLDEKTGEPSDPYKLLKNKYEDLDMAKEELFLEDGKIQDGAAALVAFGKMQFTEMSEKERASLTSALLQYCELDTLAMVMIYEHWNSI